MAVDHAERREHLERLRDDLSSQRPVDTDELFMEIIHVVLELHDDIEDLRARIGRLGPDAKA